jgi:uncharacterized protein
VPFINRRDFLKAAGRGVFALYGSALCLDAYRLEVTRKLVALRPGAKAALRIVHLSDLHMPGDVSFSLLQEAVEAAAAERPDLVLLTGDFVTRHLPRDAKWLELLRRLPAAAPTFACAGNHDGGRWSQAHGGYPSSLPVRRWLEEAGIVCLHNRSVRVDVRGTELCLVGVGDPWAEEMDPAAAFNESGRAEAAATLLLCHNPDAKDELFTRRWDLMFSGHTHGGQLIVPVLGWAPLAPIRDSAFNAGLVCWGARRIHVSRGLGAMLGLRINCRPEVAVVDLAV